MSDSSASPELESLKARMKKTWESGDFGHIAQYLEKGALKFFDRLKIQAGSRLLDIGCGSGQLTIPAAQRWIDVTGIDLAQNLVDQANQRANSIGLTLDIRQGDAEDLPFPDNSFDTSMSLFGAMFAPRPRLVASEMVRVIRPGGRAIMGNWVPEGLLGQLFKTVATFRPPPPDMPSPLMWGVDEHIRERFDGFVKDLTITRYSYPFEFPFGPAEVADLFIVYNGPFLGCFKNLDDDGKVRFRQELTDAFASANLATDGTTKTKSEYVEVLGIKP